MTDIKIKDLTWSVAMLSHDNPIFSTEDGSSVQGITFPAECDICISKAVSDQQLFRTVTHELVHAYIATYLPANNSNTLYDEEELAGFIETFGDDICKAAHKLTEELKHERSAERYD